MSVVPYRLEPRQLSLRELLRINEEVARQRAIHGKQEYFDPAELVLERIACAPRIEFETLRQAMKHPDERVPLRLIELLDNTNYAAYTAQWRDYVRAAALARGMADAAREGIVWGPLLDHLAASGQWPGPKAYEMAIRASGAFVFPVDPPPFQSAEAQAVPLTTWLARAGEKELLELLTAKSALIRLHTARFAGHPTERFVEACLRTHSITTALASNPNLTNTHVRQIVNWAVPRFVTPQASMAVLAAEALLALDQAGHRVPPDGVAALVSYCIPPAGQTGDHESRYSVLRALLKLKRGVDYDILERVAGLAATDEECGVLLVRHHAARTPIWRTIAEQTRHIAVQAQLLLSPAVQDREVLAQLARSGDSSILMGLLRHVNFAEAERIFKRLCRCDSEAAVAILDSDPAAVANLPRQALLPLLEHEEQEIRERALRALGRTRRSAQRIS